MRSSIPSVCNLQPFTSPVNHWVLPLLPVGFFRKNDRSKAVVPPNLPNSLALLLQKSFISDGEIDKEQSCLVRPAYNKLFLSPRIK
jgi:hypothetical protein